MLIYQVYEEQLVVHQMSGFRKEGCFVVNAAVYFRQNRFWIAPPIQTPSALWVSAQSGEIIALRTLFACHARFCSPIADYPEEQ